MRNLDLATASILAFALMMPAPLHAATAKFRSGTPKKAVPLVDVASDGAGTITIGYLPLELNGRGYRISEIGPNGTHEALVARPLEPAFALEATPEDRRTIETMTANARTDTDRARARALIALRFLSEPSFARAAGLLRTIHANGTGARRYRIESLEGSAPALESASVDPRAATAAVPAVAGLRAIPASAGIQFTWNPPPLGSSVIVSSYALERIDGGRIVPISSRPVLASFGWKKGAILAHDPTPPYGSEVRYQVSAIDVLGRRSAPTSVSIFATDVRALVAPRVSFRREPGRIVLAWEHSDGPMVAGYVVERSMQYGGPYAPLTPRGLAANQKTYVDSSIQPGATYFYRVRDMDPQGTLGTPSLPATASLIVGNLPMASPTGVTAMTIDAGHVRVSWPAVSDATGYTVQRSTDGRNWLEVNANPVAITHADDRFAEHHPKVTIGYRVLAVRADSRFSTPSEPTSVVLVDTHKPARPTIKLARIAADGVHLTLKAGEDTQPTDVLLISRSKTAASLGRVVASVSAATTEFVDTVPNWGEQTSYHLIAVTQERIASPLSHPITLRPEQTIPRPEAPRLELASNPTRVIVHTELADGYGVVLDVDSGGGTYRRVTGPVFAESVADIRPRPGRRTYRIAYAQTNGRTGAFAPSVTIEVPKPASAR